MDDKKSAFLAPSLIFGQLFFVFSYLGAEHTIYFWDHSMYHSMASSLYGAALDNFDRAIAIFVQSLSNDYNLLFSIPSFISFFLFGDSRLAFILTNFICFFIPYEIAVAFILRRIFSLGWNTAFFISTAALCLIPPAWVPLLQGYPDHAAAMALAFSFAITLDDRRTKKDAILLGLALGFAVLFRRHYAYGALTLLLTSGLLDLFSLGAFEKSKRISRIFYLSIFYFICGVVALGLMFAVAPDFVTRAVTTNYNSLYLSYHRQSAEFLLFAANGFGLALLIASGLGLLLMLKQKNYFALNIFLWAALWLLAWCLGPAQAGPHYLLQMLPICAAVGLAGLYLYLTEKRASFIVFVVLAVLAGNSTYALRLGPQQVQKESSGRPSAFSSPTPPVVRKDYNALVELARHLVQTTGPDDRILAIGSSPDFNQDILRAIFVDIFNQPALFLKFLQAPEVDNVQDPPYDVFASANVYVVPEPAQYHLAPEGQKVVTAAAAQFPPGKAIASLFKQDDKTFSLQNGVTVKVWRRQKDWPPQTLISMMDKISEISGPPKDPRVGPHRDWVATQSPLRITATTLSNGFSYAQGLFDNNHRGLSVFMNKPLHPGKYVFRSEIVTSPPCNNLEIELITKNKSGGTLQKMPVPVASIPGVMSLAFSVDAGNTDAFAQLNVNIRYQNDFNNMCIVSLHNLSIHKND